MKKVSFWQIFVTFFKIGAFTFGGGYAMISILQEELVSRKKWISSQDVLDMIVIAESTPGVIAVNSATFVGYKCRGVLGALVATLGVVLPSFCIIVGLSFAIQALAGNRWFQSAFKGVQACVVMLIFNAFVKLSSQLQKDALSLSLLVVSFFVSTLTSVNVIYLIVGGGVVGVVCSIVCKRKGSKARLPLENDGESCQDSGVDK